MSDASPEIRKLYARAGEAVTAKKWNALMSYIESLLNALSSLIGPDLLKDEYGTTGFFLRAAPQPAQPFVGSFFVSGGIDSLTVGLGMVDAIMPTIRGKAVDGSGDNGQIPTLDASGGPNEKLRSWVCLEAFADPETLALREELPVIVTHRTDLTAESGKAVLPLALLQWSDRTAISGIHQIVYFNLKSVVTEKDGKLTVKLTTSA